MRGYHVHTPLLSSAAIGAIIVVFVMAFLLGLLWSLTGKVQLAKSADISFCVSSGTDKKQCWEDAVIRRLKKNGISASLDLLADFYQQDPSFARPCHDVAHTIGRNAYAEFARGQPVHINEKTSYCSFGFYHGFMETLLARNADIVKAQEFCRLVDEQLGGTFPRARLACYHGVGHGVIDTHSPTNWGDERATIVPAVALCREFAQDPQQLYLCGTGIFDALAIAYYNGQNGFVMNKQDPLWICREMDEPFQEACFMDLMDAVLWLGDYDLAKAAPLAVQFVEAKFARAALKGLADASVRFVIHEEGPVIYLPVCRALKSDFHTACVEGLASGMIQFGQPNSEYVEALSFCEADDLTTQERSLCLTSVFTAARSWYSRDRFISVCKSLADEYQIFCTSDERI